MNYNVVEHFVSINGEGVKAGELAVFVSADIVIQSGRIFRMQSQCL